MLMSKSDDYDYLHELAARHYERAEYNIAEYIKDEIGLRIKEKQTNSHLIRLLDIGSGSKSTLLKALERTFQESHSVNGCSFEIHFLDIDHFEKVSGLENSPYSITDSLKEFNFKGANFKAKFIELDFNKEIGTEEKLAEMSRGGESKLSGQFDVIVLSFVIHEILDSACLEITNPDGDKDGLTTTLFLEKLFEKIHGLLAKGGMVFFGDAYFPKYISSEQTKEILTYLNERFGHADSPSLFLHPEDIIRTIMLKLKGKFALRHDTERLTEISKDSGLYRKSYFIGLRKLG